MQSAISIDSEILRAYPDLFGHKTIGRGTLHVQEVIARLTLATRDMFREVLAARHAFRRALRQLFDMKCAARNGLWADLMKPIVSKLTEDDMPALAAYTASLAP